MTRVIALLVTFVSGLAISCHVQASPLTGADLFASPNSSFPGTQPTVSGTALVFGASSAPATTINEKLWAYRTLPVAAIPSSGQFAISATVNFTRLNCQAGRPCSGEEADFDPLFFFGSGVSGRRFGFGVSDGFAGTIAIHDLNDNGIFGTNRSEHEILQNQGFPAIGEFDTLTVVVDVGEITTTITGFFRSSQISHTWNEILPRTDDLSFFLFRDNDTGEQYQIDSVEFTLPETPTPAPEPATLALLGLGLVGLGLSRRKRI